ncbi:unnamed protein product [Xyrichtys novacula]|uniref:Unnamed protein product n=1 Tax=Xyrichtys novacula TaxID=13765 RepID=A0AAV1FEU0_XYRNO|nr:unnamed protein product [Xyrichtys novacula]
MAAPASESMGGRGIWREHKCGKWRSQIPALGSTPAHRRPGKAHELMKCENTCGRGDYGLSEIQLHKLMIKPMSLRLGPNSAETLRLTLAAAGVKFGPDNEDQTETNDV